MLEHKHQDIMQLIIENSWLLHKTKLEGIKLQREANQKFIYRHQYQVAS